jgi:hypothetical protein
VCLSDASRARVCRTTADAKVLADRYANSQYFQQPMRNKPTAGDNHKHSKEVREGAVCNEIYRYSNNTSVHCSLLLMLFALG